VQGSNWRKNSGQILTFSQEQENTSRSLHSKRRQHQTSNPNSQSQSPTPSIQEYSTQQRAKGNPLNSTTMSMTTCMASDISELMPRAAAASIISLYEIIGYPDGRIPDPISWGKFGTAYGHIRRVVGWNFNTRTLTFTLPDDNALQSPNSLSLGWLKTPLQSWKQLSSMALLQMHHEQIGKGELYFLDSKMHFDALSRHDSTKCADITTEKIKPNNSKQIFQSTSTLELTL
jgi:hypothetical protein